MKAVLAHGEHKMPRNYNIFQNFPPKIAPLVEVAPGSKSRISANKVILFGVKIPGVVLFSRLNSTEALKDDIYLGQ